MYLFAFSTELPFTSVLNRLLGGPVSGMLEAFGIHPHNPAHPFSNWMAMQILVVALLIVFFIIARASLSVERPGALQHVFEGAYNFVEDQSREIIGHHFERFTPFLVTMGLFILTANLIGSIPTFESPTVNPAVPLGCALVTFIYYHFQGLRKQGLLHYVAHFFGPQDKSMPLAIRVPVSALLFPIEIASHFARLMSLTIRLFANIFAGEMVTLAFFSLVPIAVPVLFIGLHIGVSFVQTYIFVLLATVYLEGAVAEAH